MVTEPAWKGRGWGRGGQGPPRAPTDSCLRSERMRLRRERCLHFFCQVQEEFHLVVCAWGMGHGAAWFGSAKSNLPESVLCSLLCKIWDLSPWVGSTPRPSTVGEVMLCRSHDLAPQAIYPAGPFSPLLAFAESLFRLSFFEHALACLPTCLCSYWLCFCWG